MVFDELGDKVQIVVFGNHIPHHFFAVLTLVKNFESFFLVLFYVDGFHESQAGALSVSGNQFIDMQ